MPSYLNVASLRLDSCPGHLLDAAQCQLFTQPYRLQPRPTSRPAFISPGNLTPLSPGDAPHSLVMPRSMQRLSSLLRVRLTIPPRHRARHKHLELPEAHDMMLTQGPRPDSAPPDMARLSPRERAIVSKLLAARSSRELSGVERDILEGRAGGAADPTAPVAAAELDAASPPCSSADGLLQPSHQNHRRGASRPEVSWAIPARRLDSSLSPSQSAHVPRISIGRASQSPSGRTSFESATSQALRAPTPSAWHNPSERASHCPSFVSAVSHLEQEPAPGGGALPPGGWPAMTPVDEVEAEGFESTESIGAAAREYRDGPAIRFEEYGVEDGPQSPVHPVEGAGAADSESGSLLGGGSATERSNRRHQRLIDVSTPTGEEPGPTLAGFREEPAPWLPTSHAHRGRCQSLRIPQTEQEVRVARVYHSLSLHGGLSRPNPYFDEDPASPSYIAPRRASVPCRIEGGLADLFRDGAADSGSQLRGGERSSSGTATPLQQPPPPVARQASGVSVAPSSVYSRDSDGASVRGLRRGGKLAVAKTRDGRFMLERAKQWPPRSSSLGALMQMRQEEARSGAMTGLLDPERLRELEEEWERSASDGETADDGGDGRAGTRLSEAECTQKRRQSVGKELSVKLANSLRRARRLAKRSSQALRSYVQGE